MDKKYEMLQNHLKVVRAAQGAAVKIITESNTPKQTLTGKLIPAHRGPEYWEAVNELKDLMNREEVILGKMEALDPDLEFEAPEKYKFNERGELIIE